MLQGAVAPCSGASLGWRDVQGTERVEGGLAWMRSCLGRELQHAQAAAVLSEVAAARRLQRRQRAAAHGQLAWLGVAHMSSVTTCVIAVHRPSSTVGALPLSYHLLMPCWGCRGSVTKALRRLTITRFRQPAERS